MFEDPARTIEVVGEQVMIVVPDGVKKRLVDMAIAKAARTNLAEHIRKRRALLVDRDRVVHVLVADLLDVGREVAEEEHVLLADLLRDLDVRAVDSADEQAAVQAELHVRRA